MKNKMIEIMIGVVALVLILGGGYFYYNQNKDNTSKTIDLEVIVEDKTIYHEKVKTNASMLSEVLIELNHNHSLDIVYEEGEYGMFITSINGNKQDPTKGFYWTYDSKDNRKCQADGYCQAANLLTIEDGNHFVFTLDDES